MDDFKILKVQMFGGFEMRFGDKPLNFKGNGSTKSMQILKLLLSRYPESINKDVMLHEIFEYDDVLNPNNNLKVSISQLRLQLSSFSLPCDEFIRFSKGSYSWSCPLSLSKDTDEFTHSLLSAKTAVSQEEKISALCDAVQIYKGNFLPELSGIDFAEKLSAYYYEKYAEAVRELAEIYFQREKYDDCLRLYNKASEVHRCEEWQTGKIECLMRTSRFAQAKDAYHETVLTLEREFGVGPSKELLEKYKIISEKTDNAVSSFQNMIGALAEEKEASGAYYCAFPGFVDACRVLSRNMERSGISCYLMMIFLGDSSGNVIKNEERLSEGSKALFDSIQSSLRRGDSFTQYNKSQFLVFLFGTSRENCDLVSDRITQSFKKHAVRGARIHFEVTSAILNELNNLS